MNNNIRSLIFLLLASSLFLSCTATKDQRSTTPESLVNQEIVSEDGENILVGQIKRDAMRKAPYKEWFDLNYEYYTVDENTLESIKPALQSVEMLVFFGSWCSDSQMQLPQFYKILDYLEYDMDRLQLVALDNHPERYKQSPQHEEEGWDIEYVPTFIFLKEGKEIGRIVEYPMETLEKDMAMMLKNAATLNF